MLQIVTCPLCKKEFKSLNSHIIRTHKLSIKEFLEQFPSCNLVSEQTRAITSQTCKKSPTMLEEAARKKGKSLSDSHKEKLSIAFSGEKNPSYGKHHDSVSIEKMSGPRPSIEGDNNPYRKALTKDPSKRTLASDRSKTYWKDKVKYDIGQRHDKLVIKDFTYISDDNGRMRKTAICLCDCGNTITVRPHSLGHNMTNSCGCIPNGKWKGVGKLSKTFFYRLLRNAKIRNINITFSIEDIWKLYEDQKGLCALSGIPIPFSHRTAEASDASLDRIDSDKDYTLENVQWVHKDVNKMKMDLPQDRFIDLCKLIVDHQHFSSPRTNAARHIST